MTALPLAAAPPLISPKPSVDLFPPRTHTHTGPSLVCVAVKLAVSCQNREPQGTNMADTARDPPAAHSGFQELEDGEDLFQEVSSSRRRMRWW